MLQVDIYTCGSCGKGFPVAKDVEPEQCPLCKSEFWEYSHSEFAGLEEDVVINKKNYVVIDFETTGLDYKTNQITEVALIKYDEVFNELGSFNTVVKLKPGNVLSDFIKQLTGLTEDLLVKGIDEGLAMKMINSFIDKDTIVVAQYAPFDLAFMSKYAIVPKRYICTKSLTSQVEPGVSSSLKPTCERLGIQLDNAHRAFSDVKATAEVLKIRLKQNIKFIENIIVKSPDRDLEFIPLNTNFIIGKEYFTTGGMLGELPMQ